MKAGVVHSRHSAGVCVDRWAGIQMDGWKEKKARISLRDFHLKLQLHCCYDGNIQTGRTAGTSLNHCVLCLA